MNLEYEFAYEDKLVPEIIKKIYIDQELIDSTIVDISTQYTQIPINVLKDFSEFLTEKFNYLIGILIQNNLDQYKFNELNDPLKLICRIKTSCDTYIDSIENPKISKSPLPELEEVEWLLQEIFSFLFLPGI